MLINMAEGGVDLPDDTNPFGLDERDADIKDPLSPNQDDHAVETSTSYERMGARPKEKPQKSFAEEYIEMERWVWITQEYPCYQIQRKPMNV